MGWKVIQVRLDNVANIMKHIGHFPLKRGPRIFEAERELLVYKCTPWADEGCLLLVRWCDIDLVVTRETVHKGKYLTSDTFIND